MKKPIFFFLLWIIFLAGCGHKPNFVSLSPAVEPVVEQSKPLEILLPPDTWTYHTPLITIKSATGIVMTEFSGKAINEISYTANEEDKKNWWKRSTVSWYIYTYTYEDLWLRITTSALYSPYFYEKSEWLILKRNGNIIYLSGTTNVVPDYIEVFYKNSQTSFEEEIKKNHLSTWCAIQTGIFDKNSAFYPSMIGFEYILIASADGNLAPNWKIFDKQFPENILNISFVMDPKKPNKYYKFSHGDCAPGPCTIFGNIEFF